MKSRASARQVTTRATRVALVLFCLLLLLSCSTKTRQLFFDIQPPTAAQLAEKARLQEAENDAVNTDDLKTSLDSKSLLLGADDGNTPRPEIEALREWEKVADLLPKDYKKKPDWSAALEQGIISPRSGADPLSAYAAIFQWDFIIEAEKEKNDAFFPHSAHTKWLACKNCHTKIYPKRRNPATMKEMKNGASCGTCHGKTKVAFALKQCKRCHLNK